MGAQLRPVAFSFAHSGGLVRKRGQNEWAGPAVTEVKSLPGWGVCLDWRREAAGEAHVERGSGAACGDPRRPTGFVGCRPRCRALGEGSPQTELCEGAATPTVERPLLARPREAKRPLRLCASETSLTSVVSGPFPPSVRDKPGQAPSISPKWPQLVFLFIFLISLFMISTAQSSVRVFCGA